MTWCMTARTRTMTLMMCVLRVLARSRAPIGFSLGACGADTMCLLCASHCTPRCTTSLCMMYVMDKPGAYGAGTRCG